MPILAHVPKSKLHGSAFDQMGLPPVLDGAMKFAFDVLDVIAELSNGNLKLASRVRPNFQPGCQVLMTPHIKRLFRDQWDLAEDLKLIYLVLNMPRVHERDNFMGMMRDVYACYLKHEFTLRNFVEFVFCIAYWTLVLQQRREWARAPDVAVNLFIYLTRHVLDKGGFDECNEWPRQLILDGTLFDFTNEGGRRA